MLLISHHDTVAGQLIIGTTDDRLVLCDWATRANSSRFVSRLAHRLDMEISQGRTPVTAMAISQIDEYFRGERTVFDLPLLLSGTGFQLDVWNALSQIPYGTTVTYADIAAASAHKTAVRAVANAIGANRLSLIIPCHRVTATGSIGGYAGGIRAKRTLIGLERSQKEALHGETPHTTPLY